MSWLVFLVSAGVAAAIMPLVIKLAYQVGAVDVPNADVITHTRSIPLLGGLALIAGTIIPAAVFLDWNPPLAAVLGTGIILLMGLYKDVSRKDLQPLLQIAVQIFFCGLVVSSLLPLENLSLWLIGLLIIVGVALINAINFLDVSDGLCAVVAITISIGLYLAGGSIICLGLAGSLLGFFAWNRPKAKVFMGDTGSFFIGAVFYIVVIEGLFVNEWQWGVLCVFAIPFAELGFTILIRLSRSTAIMQGDASHVSLILLNSGMSPWTLLVCFAAASMSAILPTLLLFA